MKQFLAVFTGSAAAMTAWNALTDSERQQRQQQGIAAWHQWADDNAASIIDIGGPLGRTTLIGKAGISEIRNNLSGFTVLKAASKEAAARLFVGHPHFAIFPGEGVELMEILPLPAKA